MNMGMECIWVVIGKYLLSKKKTCISEYSRLLIYLFRGQSMTHIDIARNIRYRLFAELHRAAADLYSQMTYGTEEEIRAVVAGFDEAICALYAYYAGAEGDTTFDRDQKTETAA
jgi:hypothetical protein